jgi:hypothetical protein
MLAMGLHDGDEGFTWFGPPERNTLRPRENGSCIIVCSSSVGLALGYLGFNLIILTSTTTLYSSRPQRVTSWLKA